MRSFNYGLWLDIVRLYRNNPIVHVYMFYDLAYDPENTKLCVALHDGKLLAMFLYGKE